jgi:hypothetical protein
MGDKLLRTIIALFTLLLGPLALGAPHGPAWRNCDGWAQDSTYGRLFNPRTMTSISGEITEIERFAPMRGMGAGIHITVKTTAESFDVHLGPAWYLESQDVHLKRGDKVELSGSRVLVDNKPAIIAVDLKRDGDVLVLRDSSGLPRWAGWRHRPTPST